MYSSTYQYTVQLRSCERIRKRKRKCFGVSRVVWLSFPDGTQRCLTQRGAFRACLRRSSKFSRHETSWNPKKKKKQPWAKWVPHLLDPSTRAYALNTGDVTIGFLWILLTLAKWRRTKVGDKIIPGLTDPFESKPLKKLQIGFFFVHCQVSSASFSWTKSDELDNPESLFEWDMTPTLSRNYRWKLPGTPATRALESRGPCNDAPAKQLPWSIPKFSAKSRGING